ncbi:hypothetical protein AAFF_G00027760 [Aldrovandia affinis]|uniref:Uncharacterized protein n=1 Tax=Aldrovandia affinis TaxID=143900 RepID=A0AAD7WGF8_9TELE|nr:hypothetical protein AAFF_G00027760 [Aldrovandia affinis]
MDPADTENFRKAIENQDALVGQHSLALQELMEALQNLIANVTRMGNQLDLVSTHLSSPENQPNPPAPAPSLFQPVHQTREPHVPVPERCAGDLGTCREFLIQCSLVFEQQPLTYTADKSMIALWGF